MHPTADLLPRKISRPGVVRLAAAALLGGSLLAAPAARNSARAETPVNAPAAAGLRPTTRPDYHVDPRQAIGFLASDELKGRLVGTAGVDQAADYIADTFAKLGLRPPPGQGDYFQRFQTPYSISPDPKTAIGPGAGKDWAGANRPQLDEDYVPFGFTGEGSFDAPVVFVGYGISDKEHNYDDYAGVDVKGKVVLALRYEPHDEKGNSRFTGRDDDWSTGAQLTEKAKRAAEHGAAALLVVTPPTFHSAEALAPFERYLLARRLNVPVIQVAPALAEGLAKAGGAGDLKTLQAKIDASGKPASAELAGATLRGNVTLRRPEAKNVVAVLPGVGPTADEYVVIGAHYDHLGRGVPGSLNFQTRAAAHGPAPVPGDKTADKAVPPATDIHHGADDNASGTTAVLMLAEQFARAGPQPRTLVFATFTAEEEGLIGSAYFVNHSPVPLEKIAAMLNLDMVGRVSGGKIAVGGTGTAAAFDALVADAEKDSPLKTTPMGAMTGGKGGYGPSDHMSFALKKIPVLFFFSGMHVDYHRPGDTADKVNYEGVIQMADLGRKIVEHLATMPRQEYVSKYDSGGMARATSGPAAAGMGKATLGLVPDYGGDSPEGAAGVKISGTVPGSPAEKIGLQPGDILLRWNDAKIESLEGLTEFLGKSKPGDKVHLVIRRGGKQVEADAVLAERKVTHD